MGKPSAIKGIAELLQASGSGGAGGGSAQGRVARAGKENQR